MFVRLYAIPPPLENVSQKCLTNFQNYILKCPPNFFYCTSVSPSEERINFLSFMVIVVGFEEWGL